MPKEQVLPISDQQKKIVIKTIRSILPRSTIFAFGSRIRGDARVYSDLDIAIKNPDPITLTHLSQLEEAFSAGDLPFKVDLIDFARADEGFQGLLMKSAVQWI